MSLVYLAVVSDCSGDVLGSGPPQYKLLLTEATLCAQQPIHSGVAGNCEGHVGRTHSVGLGVFEHTHHGLDDVEPLIASVGDQRAKWLIRYGIAQDYVCDPVGETVPSAAREVVGKGVALTVLIGGERIVGVLEGQRRVFRLFRLAKY